jgi:hypothetical protein
MKKISIISEVNNGNLKRNRVEITNAFKSFEGKTIKLTIEKVENKRSNNQNAYYWGVIIPIIKNCIKEHWGEIWSAEIAHEFCKMQFNFIEKINEETGEIIRIPKSTTENTTTTQEELHIEIRNFVLEWFNTVIPLPNENLTLEL